MVVARVQAKQDKNWAEADRIRDALKALGIVLEDSAGATSWRRE
jgi:cysteinyl-tRNA synthetase